MCRDGQVVCSAGCTLQTLHAELASWTPSGDEHEGDKRTLGSSERSEPIPPPSCLQRTPQDQEPRAIPRHPPNMLRETKQRRSERVTELPPLC
jgi:hypothetical protein